MDKQIAARVADIKNNPDNINLFIDEYKPFIASCVRKYTGSYVEYGRDDELSVGLMAFHEAITSYAETKGNFLAFASQVIRRRLIDYSRKQRKYQNEMPIDNNYGVDDEEEYDLTIKKSIQEYNQSELEEARRFELNELKKELKEWNIDFFDVAKASPKHNGTKKLYSEIINSIICDDELVETIIVKKYMPVAKICDKLRINRKKVERGRNYIKAAVLIMLGDYEFIRDFVNWR